MRNGKILKKKIINKNQKWKCDAFFLESRSKRPTFVGVIYSGKIYALMDFQRSGDIELTSKTKSVVHF